MKEYRQQLKGNSRILRKNMTDSELLLWRFIRRKQIHNVQFYRQKPIAGYIVDFYCSKVNLVIEIDGSQHFDEEHLRKDQKRDAVLVKMGLQVLRFDNNQVLTESQSVLAKIEQVVRERIKDSKLILSLTGT